MNSFLIGYKNVDCFKVPFSFDLTFFGLFEGMIEIWVLIVKINLTLILLIIAIAIPLAYYHGHFAFLFQVIFITIAVNIIFIVFSYSTSSDDFICEKLEANSVNCQVHYTWLYGSIPISNQNFKITHENVKIEEDSSDLGTIYFITLDGFKNKPLKIFAFDNEESAQFEKFNIKTLIKSPSSGIILQKKCNCFGNYFYKTTSAILPTFFMSSLIFSFVFIAFIAISVLCIMLYNILGGKS